MLLPRDPPAPPERRERYPSSLTGDFGNRPAFRALGGFSLPRRLNYV